MKSLSAKERKSTGSHYTPQILAEFVAEQIVGAFPLEAKAPIRVLDPGLGDGELLLSILKKISNKFSKYKIEVFGFDTNIKAIELATSRIKSIFPNLSIYFRCEDFLSYALNNHMDEGNLELFKNTNEEPYDIVIANPPYVRTQVLGALKSRVLAKDFGLSGRVDLYHAFILAIARVLRAGGILGIIVSNRFMITQAGKNLRQSIADKFQIIHIWDLGDTRLFEAAVLPAVLLLQRKNGEGLDQKPKFTSIYSTTRKSPKIKYKNVIDALEDDGCIELLSREQFFVRHGNLEYGKTASNIWRLTNEDIDNWINKVINHTFCAFKDIGKIRVGVKTTADKVFIRSDWKELPDEQYPELLYNLTTHHIARRYKPLKAKTQREILYPHKSINGRRQAVDLAEYPKSANYLNGNRKTLENRKYVIEAGRKWYEIWVPQNPEAWEKPKLVFWDIAEKPTFWMDLTGSVVNGDCYWMVCEKTEDEDMLWLALAVANSTFIEEYYDILFHNKLYAGRRRFITQYVEKFPVPDPNKSISKKIIESAKEIYDMIPSPNADDVEKTIDSLVWEAFGFSIEEIRR